MTRRRMLLLFAPAGTLAAHGLAYGPLAGGDDHGSGVHAYLPFAAALAVPAAIAALLWATVARRGRATQLPSVRALVGTQLGLFLVQEVAERVAARVALSDLVSQPAVRWGVALQVLIAVAGLLAARLLRRTIGALLSMMGRANLVLAVPSVLVSVGGVPRVAVGIVSRPSARAPPVVTA